jgi:hypothetical protein
VLPSNSTPEFGKDMLEIAGEFGSEFNRRTAAWQDEAKLVGMQKLAFKPEERSLAFWAIEWVTQDWALAIGEVDPNLVCSPSFQPNGQRCILAQFFEDAPVGSCWAALRNHRHPQAILWMPPNWRIDRALGFTKAPFSHRQVHFRHGAGLLLFLQMSQGAVVPSNNYEPGSFAVEPMYNPRPQITTNGQFWVASQQRIHQRPGWVARCGVNDHACWFVDHHEIMVFIDDCKWNVFGNQVGWGWFGELDCDNITKPKCGTWARLSIVDADVGFLNQMARIAA